MSDFEVNLVTILSAFILDRIWIEGKGLPHVVNALGYLISWLKKALYVPRKINGFILVMLLVPGIYCGAYWGVILLRPYTFIYLVISIFLTYQLLAGSLLIRIGKQVFELLDNGELDQARKRLTWLVGRDTLKLTNQEVRQAALESMSENLSDGMIAPMFYFAIAGVPGMLAYKAINTLDSRIGYKNEKYREFGYAAAKLDDIANFLPARITAILISLASPATMVRSFQTIRIYAHSHLSPNAGYPESALAGVLDSRFGGPHEYRKKLVEKGWIGENDRALNTDDVVIAAKVSQRASVMFLLLIVSYWMITDLLSM